MLDQGYGWPTEGGLAIRIVGVGPQPFVYRSLDSGVGMGAGTLSLALHWNRFRGIKRPCPHLRGCRLQDLVLDAFVLHGPDSGPRCTIQAHSLELCSGLRRNEKWRGRDQ